MPRLLFIIFLLVPFAIGLATAIVKGLWWLCGVGEWTGMGDMPWTVALFIVLIFGSSGSSKS